MEKIINNKYEKIKNKKYKIKCNYCGSKFISSFEGLKIVSRNILGTCIEINITCPCCKKNLGNRFYENLEELYKMRWLK